MSLSAQEDQAYCASCGKPAAERLTTELGYVPLCEGCANRVLSGKAISFAAPISEEDESLPPEQRFEEVFKAARILLREGVTEEAQIIPTLALANEVGQGTLGLITAKERLVAAWEDSSEAWEVEADRLVREHPNFRPVRVVDGMLILEWLPVSVDIRNYLTRLQ